MMRLHAIPRTRGMTPTEAAAFWLVRGDARSLTPSEEAEFTAWKQDPANAAAFRRANGAMAPFFDSDGGADPTIRALRQAALDVKPAPRRLAWAAGGALLAASLVAIITVSGIENSSTPNVRSAPPVLENPVATAGARVASPDEYITRAGERRTVKLADGSSVTLNTRTRLTVAFSAGRRLIHLFRGEALFEVAHDRNRPFVVEAADRQVTALGTVFEVRVDPGRVNVVLFRGRVVVDRTKEAKSAFHGERLTPAFLKPGEQLSAELGSPQRITAANVDRELLWRDGFVEFDDEPLALAVAEINRYSDRPIALNDDGVGALHLSGLFRTGVPDDFIDAVSRVLPVEAKAAPQGGILLSLGAKSAH